VNTRRARLQLIYENKDITQDLQQYLVGWTFTDNLSGQADDLQITLEDKGRRWMGRWMPEEGAVIRARIIRQNWEKEGKSDSLDLGQFEIDEIEFSGPPSTVQIKALSVPSSSALKGQRKNRAWEKTRLSVVAKDVARANRLSLFYDTDDDPEYDRVDQTEETDLEFLSRMCNDAGLCLKISDARIVIFDEQKYEQRPVIGTISRGDENVIQYSGRRTLTGVYRACRVVYHDEKKDRTIRHTFTPPNPPKTGRILVVNEQVESIKQAERLAKKRLRERNREGVTFSLSLTGNIRYLAGQTVQLAGFGSWDGKYIITQATHAQQNGYTTGLSLRKCLEGY